SIEVDVASRMINLNGFTIVPTILVPSHCKMRDGHAVPFWIHGSVHAMMRLILSAPCRRIEIDPRIWVQEYLGRASSEFSIIVYHRRHAVQFEAHTGR